MIIYRLLIVAGLSFVGSGCTTTLGRVIYIVDRKGVVTSDGFEPKHLIYSGTRVNSDLVHHGLTKGLFTSVVHGPGPMGICGVIDFFPSLAMDTVILPLTIEEAIFAANGSTP